MSRTPEQVNNDKAHPYADAEAFDFRLARTEALRLAVETSTAGVQPGTAPGTPLVLRLAEVYEAWLTEPWDVRPHVLNAAQEYDDGVTGKVERDGPVAGDGRQ